MCVHIDKLQAIFVSLTLTLIEVGGFLNFSLNQNIKFDSFDTLIILLKCIIMCAKNNCTQTDNQTECNFMCIDCDICKKQEMELLQCDLTTCHLCQFFIHLR